MQYRDLFVVSSALVTEYGHLPTQERVTQTMQTLRSIRERAPHADIVVLELSKERVNDDLQQQFMAFAPKHILYFDEHPRIQSHYQWCSKERDPAGSQIKNLNEIAAMHIFLHWGQQQGLFAGYRRVFKISGRYQLSDAFDATLYEQEVFAGRCAFLKLEPSYLDVRLSGAGNYAYMTRLWSFDVQLVGKLEVWFESMFDMLLKRYEAGGYTDIEHLLSMVIPRSHCVYLPQVGVMGHVGLHGHLIAE